MSRTFELLHKHVPPRSAATRSLPAPVADEVPYIEVGGPNQVEGSADVLACPVPPRQPHLQPAAETPPAAPPIMPPVAPVAICCTWNPK